MQDDNRIGQEPLPFSITEVATWQVAVLGSMALRVPFNLVYVIGTDANHVAAGLNLPKAAPGMVYVQFNSWQVLVSNHEELESIRNIYTMETTIARQLTPQISNSDMERMRASVFSTPEHFPVFVPAPKIPFQVDVRWLESAIKVLMFWMTKSEVEAGTPHKIIVDRALESLARIANLLLSVDEDEPQSINISDKHIN
jgi:hypothetical protein